jgi:hypothetical protein
LPPKLVHLFQEVETFDQNVSNKIHKVIVAVMNAKTDTLSKVTTPAISREAYDDLTIVSGTREKRPILEACEKKFGLGYPDSIVTSKIGKLISTTLVLHSTRMRPSKDKFY